MANSEAYSNFMWRVAFTLLSLACSIFIFSIGVSFFSFVCLLAFDCLMLSNDLGKVKSKEN
jgi:hypothetical protein